MTSFKKLLALVLSAVMLCALCVPAMADWAYEDYAAAAKYCNELAEDYTGKTVILHSNDVHGALEGYAYITALKAAFVKRGADVILADAGDFSQGTIYVSSSKGDAATSMMEAAGYDVVTLGNHEFDFGYTQLMENIADAPYKVLCANVILDETGKSILDGHTIIETANGLKVGFYGMETPETATKVNPGLIKEISFVTFGDMYTCAQAEIDALKAEGADIIVGLTHLGVDDESAPNGYRSVDLWANTTGTDIMIDGHSHTEMTCGEKGEKIQSTGTKFANIGVVVIDNATKTIEDNFLMPTSNGVYTLAQDIEVSLAANLIITTVDSLFNSVFAKTEVLLNGERSPGNRTQETNLGDLITDAMVWSVVKEGGIGQDEKTVVGITNGGGIRATIQAGDITMKDINTVLPFGNTVAVVYCSGADLLEVLEASTFSTPDAIGGYPQTSGITFTIDTTIPYDQGDVYMLDGKEGSYFAPASIKRVSIQAINGEPFDPEATYAVVTNNFCAAGGDTYNIFARSEGFDTGIPMDEAVIAYIQDVLNGVVTEEAYGQPRGTETQILAPAAE